MSSSRFPQDTGSHTAANICNTYLHTRIRRPPTSLLAVALHACCACCVFPASTAAALATVNHEESQRSGRLNRRHSQGRQGGFIVDDTGVKDPLDPLDPRDSQDPLLSEGFESDADDQEFLVGAGVRTHIPNPRQSQGRQAQYDSAGYVALEGIDASLLDLLDHGDDSDESELEYPSRRLLHGCHNNSRRSCRSLPKCPRCRFPSSRSNTGHCRATENGVLKFFTCARRTGTRTGGAPISSGDSILSADICPAIHAASWPGHFDARDGGDYDGDYTYEDPDFDEEIEAEFLDLLTEFSYDDVDDVFKEVDTPLELQNALARGTRHILITAHLDMRSARPVPDLPKPFEALNNSIGRVLNSTLSITGRCTGPPPSHFFLSEPVPPGACAILVKEDFIDAPLGTTCLMLDSIYVKIAETASRRSAVLVLHVDGLMWITYSVFQGSGRSNRAIDTNTINGGQPELFISHTTFRSFRRGIGPGVLLRSNARLTLDGVVFRNLSRIYDPKFDDLPEGSAIAAYDGSFVTVRGITIEENLVLGEPAGIRAITIPTGGLPLVASPRMEVWQWPDGPSVMSFPDTRLADNFIVGRGQPQLEAMQSNRDENIELLSRR